MNNPLQNGASKNINLNAAKLFTICYIVYCIIQLVLRAQFFFFDDTSLPKSTLSFFTPFILWSISGFFFIVTYYYLSRFFKLIGYRKAWICINILIIFTLANCIVSFVSDYIMYKTLTGVAYQHFDLMRRLLIIVSELLNIIIYILDVVLAFIIIITHSEKYYPIVKSVGAWSLIYAIVCILLYVVDYYLYDFIWSADVLELDDESEFLLMQFKGFVFSLIRTIPFVIVSVAMIRMYNKYQKMEKSEEAEAEI